MRSECREASAEVSRGEKESPVHLARGRGRLDPHVGQTRLALKMASDYLGLSSHFPPLVRAQHLWDRGSPPLGRPWERPGSCFPGALPRGPRWLPTPTPHPSVSPWKELRAAFALPAGVLLRLMRKLEAHLWPDQRPFLFAFL